MVYDQIAQVHKRIVQGVGGDGHEHAEREAGAEFEIDVALKGNDPANVAHHRRRQRRRSKIPEVAVAHRYAGPEQPDHKGLQGNQDQKTVTVAELRVDLVHGDFVIGFPGSLTMYFSFYFCFTNLINLNETANQACKI